MIRKFLNYVSWSAGDGERLRRLLPFAQPLFPGVIKVFYDKILSTPEMAATFTEGPRQVERLKLSLERWLVDLFRRERDAEYGVSIERIGEVHVRIGLDLHFMVTMMNSLGERLSRDLLSRPDLDTQDLMEDLASLHKALALDLALMLHSYSAGRELLAVLAERQAAWERLREQENLALVGRMASVVAHEVKNPLAALSSVIQTLVDKMETSSQDKELGLAVLKRVDSLNRYIDDLLTFARQRPLNPVPVDPGKLVTETVDFFRKDPRHGGVEIHWQEPAGLPQVPVDPDSFHRLLLNLLLNAAEAQNGRGRVSLALDLKARTWKLSVSDQGPGVRIEDRDKIFQPFETSKKTGSGLGLAQAQQTALAHGGRVWLEETPGPGATFSVELPLA